MSKRLTPYFSADETEKNIGHHVKEFFEYCNKHQIFWDAETVYVKCPACYSEEHHGWPGQNS